MADNKETPIIPSAAMTQLSAPGLRQFQPHALAHPGQDARSAAHPAPATARAPGASGIADAVTLSQSGIDLSAQGLSSRVDALGNATVDAAQSFIASFAQQLFGDAANGTSISFDSASLSVQSGFAAQVSHSSGARGSSDSAAFSLDDSTHFIGKGKITTADGHTFDFEIDVQYESHIQAAATRSSSNSNSSSGSAAPAIAAGGGDRAAAPAPAPAPTPTPTPTHSLPDVAFPGGLGDLFKLLGQQLDSQLPTGAAKTGDADSAGTLRLRLLQLLTPAEIAPTPAKALVDAYNASAA